MPPPEVPDETVRQAAGLRLQGLTEKEIAQAMGQGVTRSKVQHYLYKASLRGYLGTRPVLPGFAISQTTEVRDAGGNVQREFIQQKPERGEKFEVPEGHEVKGYSALVDGNGNTIQQWIKTQRERESANLIEAAKAAFAEYKGHAKLPAAPKRTDDNLLNVYNIADHHLGLYSWAKEAGEDYDLAIGERLLKDSVSQLVSLAPPSTEALILNLGDFFHADSKENRTNRSGHVLDVDTRYPKVLSVGVKLMIWCVELALQRHKRVTVKCLQGNHDEHTAIALAIALDCFFHGNKRVTVDLGPSLYYRHVFGRVLIGAHHGHEAKMGDMSGIIASNFPEDWGKTDFRYVYTGHIHHGSKIEKNGVTVESFQTLAAKDAWAAGKGYSAGRSMVAITHDRELGEVMRHTVSVKRR